MADNGVTEFLLLFNFFGRRGSQRGTYLLFFLGGGPIGRHRNDFFPIPFTVHNQKSNGGRRAWPPRPTPIVTPLITEVQRNASPCESYLLYLPVQTIRF